MTHQQRNIERTYKYEFLLCHVSVQHCLMNGHGKHNCYYFQLLRNVIFVSGFDVCFNALYFKSPSHLVHKLVPPYCFFCKFRLSHYEEGN